MAEQEQKRREMTLRIPPELKDKLETLAESNKRSLTREIELALEKYVREQGVDYGATKVVS